MRAIPTSSWDYDPEDGVVRAVYTNDRIERILAVAEKHNVKVTILADSGENYWAGKVRENCKYVKLEHDGPLHNFWRDVGGL